MDKLDILPVTKWAIYLMSLKSLVETRKSSPDPNDTHINGDGPD
jgi:hypothetical protein